MIRNFIRYAALGGLVVGLAACDLAIANPNQGDTERVIGSPEDAEALLSTYYKRWHSGVYGSTGNLEGMANNMSLMNYSSLANNCQNNHIPFTGYANPNTPGNVCAGEQARLYQYMGEVNRVASNVLSQMDAGLTLGTTDKATDARNLRARAWGEFLRGLSLGYTAMIYDSSAIVSPNMSTTPADCVDAGGVCTGALRNYTEVLDSALAAFDRALTYTNATTVTGTGGFPIPNSWLPSPTDWTTANFTRLIRSYRARIRANVARSAAEPVDWAAVVADAQNGFTADHEVTTSTTAGPFISWRQQYDTRDTWHQMTPFIIGMADNSGSYAAWLSIPLSNRGAGNAAFFMTTPDLRFPQGATRAAQQADFLISQCEVANTDCKRYFVNRPSGSDNYSGDSWAQSNYDFVRFRSWARRGDGGQARNGNTPIFTLAELDLLQAEGLYKLGATNDAAVATLINKTRTRGMVGGAAQGGGLPAVTAANRAAPVAGGADCVPKVPVPAGNGTATLTCGNLWEALKYEKRIETAYTHFAPWYLDSRRWDDLPKDTPLFWATPYQDLQARGRSTADLYGTGPGQKAPNSVAPGSAYGW
ncbi:MAG TPA: RagB/SusD family nutrient uptake outer membrane protein [Gemmatimonadaceae bacterium]|nr:RagB/SusD family nutrient uptake outer membrane protein [Gemmatimonadaceae bacterium]